MMGALHEYYGVAGLSRAGRLHAKLGRNIIKHDRLEEVLTGRSAPKQARKPSLNKAIADLKAAYDARRL